MALFVVVPQPGPNGDRLEASIAASFSAPSVQRLNGKAGWLIVTKMTPEEVSKQVGIHDGINGSGIVFQVATYSGRADPDIWAWINATWGQIDV